jgi:hypothetical protein
MKNLIILIIAILTSIISFAQENGIYLVNKKNNDSIVLLEHKRIKISTIDGKTVVGKFAIIDNATIMIKGQEIALDSIVKIRRASTFHAILDPVCIFFGSIFIVGGIAAIYSGGYASVFGVLILPGIPMVLIPAIKNNHKSNKWIYKIQKQSQ